MKLLACLLLLFLVAALPSAWAQTLNADDLRTVNVDAISDAEIKTYYDKVRAAGYSTDQLLKMAGDRGMPAGQVEKLRNRLALIETTVPGKVDAATPSKKESAVERELSGQADALALERIKRDTSIFGAEIFMQRSLGFEPNLRIATPAGYTLGPGDELQVNVFGYSEQAYSLTVSAEGNVYIPNVGPIAVSGLTVEEASSKIKSKLAATIYKAIKSGQTRVQVSLVKIRSIQVTVVGQAFKPGTYTVSSLSTLFNVLYLCGGPNDMGSYRTIELLRGNKVVRKADLYNFLLRGDRKDNLMLQDQDVIRIPYYAQRVVIKGEARRTGKFEVREGDNFDALLTYCGGFTDSAFRSRVTVARIAIDGLEMSDVTPGEFALFAPRNGDSYTIRKINSRFTNRVSIAGAVLRPGDYELKPGMGPKQLIEAAGGLKPDAYLERGLVLRQKPDLTLGSVAFNVKNVLAGSERLELAREDQVTISSILELKDQMRISVEGEIRQPGAYVFREGLKLKDLILLAGGFADGADPSHVEVSRRNRKAEVQKQDYQQTELLKVSLENGISSPDGDLELQPFDLVIVRPKGSYERQRSVIVEGLVMSPGRFVLETSNERLSKVLERAGGFKGAADSGSLTIRRFAASGLTSEEKERILTRVMGISRDSLEKKIAITEQYLKATDLLSVNVENIKANPGGPEDLIMEDGDIITIYRATSLVRVSGEVYNPSLLPFDEGSSAKYYIRRSGDFTPNAQKSRVFVIYPDGRTTSVNKFLLFKSYPSVKPRSEIFVPSKDKEAKKGLTTGEWIAISSIIASLATMAVTIANAF